MDPLNMEENVLLKNTHSSENMNLIDTIPPASVTGIETSPISTSLTSPLQTENVMRRDHDSVDDFEHLEPESSPVKESPAESLISTLTETAHAEVKSSLQEFLPESTKLAHNLLDFEETGVTSETKTDASKQNILDQDIIPDMHDTAGNMPLLDIPTGLHKAVTEPVFPSHLVGSTDEFGEKSSSPYDVSDKIQFESGIDLSDLIDGSDDKKPLVHQFDEKEEEEQHIPKAKEELEAVYRTEPKHSSPPKEEEPEIVMASERETIFGTKEEAEGEIPAAASMTPEPDTEEEEPPVPLPKDYDDVPVQTKDAQHAQLTAADDGLPEIAACDLSGFCAWFKPEMLPPAVGQLVYWRDPKKSGLVFGTLMVALLSLTVVSLISVVAYLSLAVLTGTIIFRVYKSILQAIQKTEDGHPFKELLEADITLTQDKVQEVTELAVSHVNGAVTELRRLFLVEDLVDSIKFGVLLWCLTYVGAWFNGLTLIILCLVGAFTLPKVYENNKAQIDQYIDLVRSKMADVSSKVKAAIPLGKKDKEQ